MKNKPHKHAEHIKDWADGRPMQYQEIEGGKWFNFFGDEAPAWNQHAYRRKPEPLECWVNMYSRGRGQAYPSEESAIACSAGDTTRVAVHMREVES